MTEHPSARRRPRVPRGRHAAAPRPSAASPADAPLRDEPSHALGGAATAGSPSAASPVSIPGPGAYDPPARTPHPLAPETQEFEPIRDEPVGPATQPVWTPGPPDGAAPPTQEFEPIRDEPPAERTGPAYDEPVHRDAAGHDPETERFAPLAAEPAAAVPVATRSASVPQGGDGGGGGDDDGYLPGSSAAGAGRGRRRARLDNGSLPRAAGWTVLTAILPGAGLLTTRLRVLGIIMLALVVLTVGGAVAWYLLGDPMSVLPSLIVNRTVLIGLLVAAIAVGLIWMLQILLANRAHNGRERLRGGRRAISIALAALLMIGVAAPFAQGARSLYAAQGLLGNTTVFSGTSDGKIVAGKDPWADTERLNVMLLGQDAGADREGTRPDTIMVASIDTKTGRTALFSIPRNLQYVRFPAGTVEAQQFPEGFDAFGKDENLINAVWQWGDEHKDLFPGDANPGLTATRHAVEQTLGLKTDYYGMVDLQGFQDLVDAIGGVDINVERRIPIGGGTNQATGGKYPISGYIEPGEQHLDGFHALWYARSREGSDDYNRMCRQQRMVRTVSEQANPATLALAFPKLVTATENNIVTDIPPDHLDAFVKLAQRVQKAGFQSYPITHDIDAPGSTSWNKGGHPDWDYLHEWVQSSIKDSMASTTAQSVSGAKASAAPSTIAATPSPSATASAAPTTSAPAAQPTPAPSTDAAAAPAAPATAAADPLKSCLPAGEQG